MSAAPRPETSSRLEPFRLRGANFNLLVLRLLDPRAEVVMPALGDQFRRAPGFLRFAPMTPFKNGELDLDTLEKLVEWQIEQGSTGLVPVGTTGGTPEMRNAAMGAGLPPLRTLGKEGDAPAGEIAMPAPQHMPPQPAPVAAPPPPPPAPDPVPIGVGKPAMIVDQPVRAGTRIWAQGSDLVVVGTVNPGAEVIADGHIHVYAPLRGKAIAGATGDISARIFSTCMEPELISVAGIYQTTDPPLPVEVRGKAAQVRLDGDTLVIEAIKA